MIKQLVMLASVATLAGCGTLDTSTQTAAQGAGAACATAGAALQSMVVAGATAAIAKVKPDAEVLNPVCTAHTPGAALTAAEQAALAAIAAAAAPYMRVSQ